MAIFKIVNKSYKNWNAVQNTIGYILRWGTPGAILFAGGCGVDYRDYQKAAEQFRITKNIFHKTDRRQVMHMIVSFDSLCKKKLTIEDLQELAFKIGQILSKGAFQIVWACHTDSDNLHIHYIINSVSYVTGRKYRLEPGEIYHIRYTIEVLIAPKIYTPQRIMEIYQDF